MGKRKSEAQKPEVDLLGQLTVTLDTEYRLRPSRQAISNIEQTLGKGLRQIAVESGSLVLSLAEMGVCVAELMKAHGAFDPNASLNYKDPQPERLADLIYESGPVEVAGRLGVIMIGALAGGYTAAGEPRAAGMKTTEPTPTAS